MADNDDDYVTSLYSYVDVDDGHGMGGGVERWEILDDSLPLGSNRFLMSPVKSNMKSMSSLYDGGDAPPLITPIDASLSKSLATHLLEKSSSNISYSSLNSTEKKKRKKKRERKKGKSPKSNL